MAALDVTAEPEIPPARKMRILLAMHIKPDLDSICGSDLFDRFIYADKDKYEVEFDYVPSGTQVKDELAAQYDKVEHIDTGGGQFDQHGKNIDRGSSTLLVAEHFGLMKKPGVAHIVELTRKSDNIEKTSPSDLPARMKGFSFEYRDPETRKTDWDKVVQAGIKELDAYYGRENHKAESVPLWKWMKKERFARTGKKLAEFLPNGMKFGDLDKYPRVREIALTNEGFDVVAYRQNNVELDWGDMFYPLISMSQERRFDLKPVIAALRTAEAEVRGESVDGLDLTQGPIIPQLGDWFSLEIPVNGKSTSVFLCCGSGTHPLSNAAQYTRLTWDEIVDTVRTALGKLKVVKKPEEKPAPKPAVQKKKPAAKKVAKKKAAAKTKAAIKKKA